MRRSRTSRLAFLAGISHTSVPGALIHRTGSMARHDRPGRALRTIGPSSSVPIHEARSAPAGETEGVERVTLDRGRQSPEGNEPTMSYYGTDIEATEASFDDPTAELEANAEADSPEADLGDGGYLRPWKTTDI